MIHSNKTRTVFCKITPAPIVIEASLHILYGR